MSYHKHSIKSMSFNFPKYLILSQTKLHFYQYVSIFNANCLETVVRVKLTARGLYFIYFDTKSTLTHTIGSGCTK